MIVGKVIKDKTNPPTKGTDLGIPKKLIKTARPRSPKIIDGTAAKLLILTSIKSVNLFLTAKFSKYIAVKTPTGKLRIRVTKIVIKDPIVAPKKPATSGSRLSPFKNKLLQILFLTLPREYKYSSHKTSSSSILRSLSGRLVST